VLKARKSDGSMGVITLKDIVYVPSFPVKIFSSLKLLMISGTITRNSLIKPDGQEIAMLDITYTGAYLVLSREPLANQSISQSLAVPTVSSSTSGAQSLELWHRRLGHTSIENVKLTSYIVKGMEIDPDSQSEFHSYIIYNIAKAIRYISREL
jgi:hypothetical protein